MFVPFPPLITNNRNEKKCEQWRGAPIHAATFAVASWQYRRPRMTSASERHQRILPESTGVVGACAIAVRELEFARIAYLLGANFNKVGTLSVIVILIL